MQQEVGGDQSAYSDNIQIYQIQTIFAYSNPDLLLLYSVPLSGTGQVVTLQCLYKLGAEIISKLI